VFFMGFQRTDLPADAPRQCLPTDPLGDVVIGIAFHLDLQTGPATHRAIVQPKPSKSASSGDRVQPHYAIPKCAR